MADAQIVVQDYSGAHNRDLKKAQDRLIKGNSYKDLSTICVIPTRGMIHAKVVQSWWGMMAPMNQKFLRMFIIGMEVGKAYSSAIEQILANPELSSWKYILTLEEDNLPPPDGLLKLIESIEGGVDNIKYDAIGGLYWTKGEGGQPMIYGNPKVMPKNFIPQLPVAQSVQECNGLGMGFTLFRLEMFKDKKLRRPWFETIQKFTSHQGTNCFTQDLWFFNDANQYGHRFACDTRVLVGHYDKDTDTVW
jgi:hypothetical protein